VAERQYSSDPVVEIDGQPFPGSPEHQMAEVAVDLDVNAPGSCTITILDSTREALKGVQPGTPLTVSAAPITGTQLTVLFAGEVYALEFEADERGTYSRVIAYDPLYRLKQHRVTVVYPSMTDSDIVRKIAGDTGIDLGDVDDTTEVHEYISQMNTTYWDFLQGRARANGYELVAQSGKLCFGPPQASSNGSGLGGRGSTNNPALTSGENLTQVRVRTTAAQQVGEVEIRGWDPIRKQELVSTRPADTVTTELGHSSQSMVEQAGSTKRVVTLSGTSLQSSVDQVAAAASELSASSFVYVEGATFGDPRLQPRTVVALADTGAFDGDYTLSRTRHVFRAGDYSTRFWVSGNHDRTSFASSKWAEPAGTRWNGVYPATVHSLKDEAGANRVQVAFKWLDDSYVSGWAHVTQPGAAAEGGISWFPEVNDQVLVSFLNGDPGAPVVIGSLHSNQDKPPFSHIDADKGVVDIRGLQSRTGHRLVFHDKGGEEHIELASGDGKYSIRLDQKAKALVIDTAEALAVKAAKDLTIEAKNITIEAAGGEMTLKGNPINLNPPG
jgi:phage protein D/phage baseplate assembly protein gpV